MAKINSVFNEKNMELIAKTKKGDREARNQLVEANLGLVHNIAKTFDYNSYFYEEIFQEGVIGLIKAIDNFDANKGVSFSSYASRVIRNQMVDFLYDNYRVIRIPRDRYTEYKIYKLKVRTLEQRLMRTPSIKEIAEFMDCDIEYINVLKNLFQECTSINSYLDSEECEIVFAGYVDSPEEEVIQNDTQEQIHKLMENSNLTEKELEILRLHYGFYDNRTYSYQEIAKKFDCHRSNIGHINNKILAKLRKKCNLS